MDGQLTLVLLLTWPRFVYLCLSFGPCSSQARSWPGLEEWCHALRSLPTLYRLTGFSSLAWTCLPSPIGSWPPGRTWPVTRVQLLQVKICREWKGQWCRDTTVSGKSSFFFYGSEETCRRVTATTPNTPIRTVAFQAFFFIWFSNGLNLGLDMLKSKIPHINMNLHWHLHLFISQLINLKAFHLATDF